jgi:hypothetical protein
MINYQLVLNATGTQSNSVNKFVDNKQVLSVPLDQANTDYQAYLKWVAEGNTPLPAENE